MASLAPEEAGKPATLALERTCYTGGHPTWTLHIDREASVDAWRFAIPAGYEPMSMQLPDNER